MEASVNEMGTFNGNIMNKRKPIIMALFIVGLFGSSVSASLGLGPGLHQLNPYCGGSVGGCCYCLNHEGAAEADPVVASDKKKEGKGWITRQEKRVKLMVADLNREENPMLQPKENHQNRGDKLLVNQPQSINLSESVKPKKEQGGSCLCNHCRIL